MSGKPNNPRSEGEKDPRSETKRATTATKRSTTASERSTTPTKRIQVLKSVVVTKLRSSGSLIRKGSAHQI